VLRVEDLSLNMANFALRADFSLPEGARLAVVGPSGAGKSTLLLLLAGFLRPDAGRMVWNDQNMTHLPPAARPVSMLFQDQNLFPHMTLLDNALLGLTEGRRATAVQRERAALALAEVGLAGFEQRKPAQVSGGQMARAALARVLLQARPILLLDEPFAALDRPLRAEMLDLVAKVAGQTQATVLMVSHDREDAQRLADWVLPVQAGMACAIQSAVSYFANENGPADKGRAANVDVT